MGFCIGLDLGQAADYTALAVVEKGREKNTADESESFLHLRHL
jgi:hypothetical protein